MNFKKITIVLILFFVGFLLMYFGLPKDIKEVELESTTGVSKNNGKNDAVTVSPKEDSLPTDSENAAYVPYSDSSAMQAAQKGKAVIFFHAKWCPTCKAADTDISENLSALPKDLVIFRADYDSEKALKQKYGVTTQHTFVQVDSNGNEITKWVGGEVESIIKNIL